MMRILTLRLEREADIPRLRQVGLALTRNAGFDTFAQTRTVTALMEIGRNTIVHGGGGRMMIALVADGPVAALRATASDSGPGLPDPTNISRQRAGDGAAGLGLGLQGVRRIADRFELESGEGGTRVTVLFETDHPASAVPDLAGALTEAVATLDPVDAATALAQQNQDLLRALGERDLLLSEVHHRTRNNLSLVNSLVRLSARSAKGDEARQLLTDLGLRIEAVVGVHEQLERVDKGDRVDLIPFLEGITHRIRVAFSDTTCEVEIVVSGADVQCAGQMSVDIGLIVGELLTNAFKHAFKDRETGRIAVTVTEDVAEGRLELIVHDDGPGLPIGMDRPVRPNSIGWRVVDSMTARHGGRIEVSNADGLRVGIVFDNWSADDQGPQQDAS